MSNDPYFATVTAVTHRLHVLTRTGDIRRVTALGIKSSGEPVPIASDRNGFTYASDAVHMGSLLSCHLASVRGHRADTNLREEN